MTLPSLRMVGARSCHCSDSPTPIWIGLSDTGKPWFGVGESGAGPSCCGSSALMPCSIMTALSSARTAGAMLAIYKSRARPVMGASPHVTERIGLHLRREAPRSVSATRACQVACYKYRSAMYSVMTQRPWLFCTTIRIGILAAAPPLTTSILVTSITKPVIR